MLQQMGGSGTINPVTGLPEFFKNFFKKVGNAIKSAGKAVVKVVKSIGKSIQKIAKTPIGKVAIGVGLAIATVATGGAAAVAAKTGLSVGAVAGAAGGMGASLIAGDSTEDVIKNGLYGGTLGYGADKLGVTGFGGTGGETGSFTDIAGNLGSTVYQKGKELISGSGTNPDGTPGKSFLGQVGDTLKDAKDVIAIGAPLLTLGAGGFDPAETSPEDLEMGFTGESPTRSAMDLIAADPERYKITMGDITQSRTENPFAQTGAIDTSLPTVGLPSIPVAGMPTVGQPQPPVPEMPQVAEYPSPFLPPSSGSTEPTSPEMMYDPRTIALAEQYNIDLARGFAAGGIVQHFAKGGSVSARMAREYEAQRSAASRAKSAASSKGKSSVASRVAKSRVNSATNRKSPSATKAIRAQDKKFAKPVSAGSARARVAQREAASRPKVGATGTSRSTNSPSRKYTPIVKAGSAKKFSASRSVPTAADRRIMAANAAREAKASAKKFSASRSVPTAADRRIMAANAAREAKARQATLDRQRRLQATPAPRPTPAPAPRPTPAPAPRPTPAPAPRPTPAPAPRPTPAPPINIGGATPAPPPVAAPPTPTPTPVLPAPPVAPPPTPTPVFPAPPVAAPPTPTPTPVFPAPPVAAPPTPTPTPVFPLENFPAPPVAPSPTPVSPAPPPTPTPVFPAPPQVMPSFPGFGAPDESNSFFPSNPSFVDAPANPSFPGFGAPDASNPFIQGFNQGGIATMNQPVYGYVGGGTPQYPNRDGEIAGPGTGTSDDIPAMLSDGEFVFTAKAVRNLGGGDRKEGAKRMYAMMKKLEAGGMA
jgi:hypothetical protein